MRKKHLVMVLVGMFVCGILMSGYMLRNGYAKADEAQVTEVEIDDGFVVLLENNSNEMQHYNNQGKVSIAEAQVEITSGDENINNSFDSNDIIKEMKVEDINNSVVTTPIQEVNKVTNEQATQVITEKKVETVKYGDYYSEIVSAEHDKNYSAAQGFDISGNIAYYAKIDNASNDVSRKARIYAYDFTTKKTSVVYENNQSDTTFMIGHANCLCIKDNYMYIATMLDNGPSIYRYTITNNSGRIILTDLQKYTVYSHDKTKTSGIKITGIHYAKDLNAFFAKLGPHVYYGNFEGNEFKWTKHFKIDTDLSLNTDASNVKLNANDYTQQGMYYSNGALYFPMTNSKTWNESIVVRYPVSASTQAESVLAEDSNYFVRLTSSKYKKLFEIECVAEYNGQLYAFNNNTTSSGATGDSIIKVHF